MSNTAITRDQEGIGRTSGRRLLLALAGWIGGSVAAGYATVFVGRLVAPEWAADPDNLAVVIVAEVYALLTAALLVVVGGRGRSSTALAIRPVSRRQVMLALGALGLVYLISAVGYTVADLIASPEPSVIDVILGIGSDGGRLRGAGLWAAVLILIRILILVPLGEELLFRGAMFGWLRRKLSPGWSIVISSALFAAIHQIPVVLPAAFLFGAAMAWVREHTGSVIPGVVAHTVNGLVLVVASYVATGWTALLPV